MQITLSDISNCPSKTLLELIPKEPVIQHALDLYETLDNKYKDAIILTAKHVTVMDCDVNKQHDSLVKTDINANSDFVLEVVNLVSCLIAQAFCKAVDWNQTNIEYKHDENLYDQKDFPFI